MARDYKKHWIQVTFEPDGTRNVFALDCYKEERAIETYTNQGNPALVIRQAEPFADRIEVILTPAQARRVVASLSWWLNEYDTPIPAEGETTEKEKVNAQNETANTR